MGSLLENLKTRGQINLALTFARFFVCDFEILTNIRRNLAYDITKEELATLYQLELLQC